MRKLGVEGVGTSSLVQILATSREVCIVLAGNKVTQFLNLSVTPVTSWPNISHRPDGPCGWTLLSGSMTALFLPESKCSEDLWRPGLENSRLLK